MIENQAKKTSGAVKDSNVILSGHEMTLCDLVRIAQGECSVSLSENSLIRVQAARQVIERRLQSNESFYGINTGFGALSEIKIPAEKLGILQLNLIRSHACGVSDPLSEKEVRAILALRIQTMMRGNSGVKVETIQLMCEFLNHHIHPIIPCRGSVGACGDLAPLAHLAMGLIGEAEVIYKGVRTSAAAALAAEGLKALVPAAKEGLCLINGTQVMTALGLLQCHEALLLVECADVATAMTLDATRGTATAYRAEIQNVRPHPGQTQSANYLRALLRDDAIAQSHSGCGKVQDPYSIRCAPQVHGAVRDALTHVLQVLLREANSSTDNPLVFAESDEILSGGNFHGEPVALVLDYLCIAVSELAGISERRIDKLVNPHMSGLPAFLAPDSGLNSGFMIPHVVAAALVNENKVLSHPASVDSIPTSADKEDHVSMGMTSALKLCQVVKNVRYVLAIELIAAAQGLEFHLPMKGGIGVRIAYDWVRKYSSAMNVDRSLSADIEAVSKGIALGELSKHLAQLNDSLA